ncbi:MAG: hypothetical protein ALECFALPRED_002352 [Alectoria fallacina]|uniref:Uncharacterized protein n=1 Tax=Alectoria fallacina TaxID=1903189 RepID=A0A8H3FEX1_9LECA|nr:MAG: hypothetical protein ALECFALPRED_002352 [Alectoria fallacina]
MATLERNARRNRQSPHLLFDDVSDFACKLRIAGNLSSYITQALNGGKRVHIGPVQMVKAFDQLDNDRVNRCRPSTRLIAVYLESHLSSESNGSINTFHILAFRYLRAAGESRKTDFAWMTLSTAVSSGPRNFHLSKTSLSISSRWPAKSAGSEAVDIWRSGLLRRTSVVV